MTAIKLSTRERRSRTSQQLLGPTVLHLRHELFMWVSLTILSAASLQSLYKSSFGLSGDVKYIILASCWLARHWILRVIYTSDTSTSRSPTLKGVLAHWLASTVVAGQYFDRSDAQVVARNVGTAHVNEDVLNPTSAFTLPSLTYTWKFVRVHLVDPILSLFGRNNIRLLHRPRKFIRSMRASVKGSFANPSLQRIAHFSPPLQLVLGPTLFLFCIYYLRTDMSFASSSKLDLFAITMQPTSRQDGSYTTSGYGDILPHGAYGFLVRPSWHRLAFFMSFGTTMLCILFYARISFPIADLVAGTNVLKALRSEAKGSSGKSHKTRVQKDHQDSLWAESYKSIIGENRFQLACHISWLRIADAIICCSILPRSMYVCRVTEHCNHTPSLAELSKILYPAGVASAQRDGGTDYDSMYHSLNQDYGSAFLVVVSIVLITCFLLLAQLVVLNKSYLAIMGHLAGEWKKVEGESGAASQWDPRRRYKKGDKILFSVPGLKPSVYVANTNSPEGQPFHFYLRATHSLFRDELGHSSTSQVIANAAKIHSAFMGFIVVVIVYYMIMEYSIGALLTTLIANLIACYGMLRTGLMDYDELEDLAGEINLVN